ncbi:MAG: hypothetical protein QNI90_17710 [Dinoroseobacter sp.]|nr:hypothetical protein [Dinoroseobacter sp.]
MASAKTPARLLGAFLIFGGMGLAAGKADAAAKCPQSFSSGLPDRIAKALPGSEVMTKLQGVNGTERDAAVVGQVLSGNVPDFLRQLTPVSFSGKSAGGEHLNVTVCVTPEYLAVGNDRDFVRVPMGLAAAAQIAVETGFLLPTPKIVDGIYGQADLRLPPRPMKPTAQMVTTAYLVEHDRTLDAQRAQKGSSLAELTAGQKKDIVLTKRLRTKPGRVAIYGWHQPNGKPIQPLSTVHGAAYADYSHGVRLVSRTAFVNGERRDLATIIEDPSVAHVISSEGPIADPERLLAAQF